MARSAAILLLLLSGISTEMFAQGAQSGQIAGRVTDSTGGALVGVTVELSTPVGHVVVTATDAAGQYGFMSVAAGQAQLSFTLMNFAGPTRRAVTIEPAHTTTFDAVLQLSLTADVTVTAPRSFVNLAELDDPEENLVGTTMAASQGAITAKHLETRPVMRAGEVLETVPGLVISQHSGEGKANQYYVRGFNLDHGTDFATTVAGVPVNMPTHAHGHGYTDVNFLIPELVSGVQYKKGPYFADEGDFSVAGAANVNYVNVLDRPLVTFSGGGQGWGRLLSAISPRVGRGTLLAAFEASHHDGPWERPDAYRKLNGLVRYSQGNAATGFSLTGMAYRGEWNSTDQVARRAIEAGRISRFGNLDTTDGGKTHRYSLSADGQWNNGRSVTSANVFALDYALNLFSNFTYYLDDPERGDQFEQADRRMVSGGRVTHRRLNGWGGRTAENLFGAQLRHDAIEMLGLYHTQRRDRLSTVREDSVGQTSLGLFAQTEYQWGAGLRTVLGIRGDVYRFNVSAGDAVNSGTHTAGLASPKFAAILGPWNATELYVNAGYGFHSNDARGTMTRSHPSTGEAIDRVTPLVRARGAEVGLRTVRIPHTQSTLSAWVLGIESELLFVGDAGTTEASRPSRRSGIEWATYVAPRPWLTLDLDLALSRAHFTDRDPVGTLIPGAIDRVMSLGVAVDRVRNISGSIRLRYFGPRPLIEDGSVRSKGTSLVNAQLGYRVSPRMTVTLDAFNLLNTRASDVDYYYTSRLLGEPSDGVDDVHTHPASPRTARVSLRVGF